MKKFNPSAIQSLALEHASQRVSAHSKAIVQRQNMFEKDEIQKDPILEGLKHQLRNINNLVAGVLSKCYK
jgi:hypothetical protein